MKWPSILVLQEDSSYLSWFAGLIHCLGEGNRSKLLAMAEFACAENAMLVSAIHAIYALSTSPGIRLRCGVHGMFGACAEAFGVNK